MHDPTFKYKVKFYFAVIGTAREAAPERFIQIKSSNLIILFKYLCNLVCAVIQSASKQYMVLKNKSSQQVMIEIFLTI